MPLQLSAENNIPQNIESDLDTIWNHTSMETNCNMNSQEIPSYSSIITSEIEALTKLWKIVSRPVMLNLNKA